MAERMKRKRTVSSSSRSASSVESDEPPGVSSSRMSESEAPAPSCVSMKSDASMFEPLNFAPEKKQRHLSEQPSSCSVCGEDLMDPVQFICGHWSCKRCVSSDWYQSDSPADDPCPQCGKRSRGDPEHQRKAEEESGSSRYLKEKKNFREAMKNKFVGTSEGNGDQQIFLNSIYTELYVTTGESEGPQAQHEFGAMEYKLIRRLSFQRLVNLKDIFQTVPGQVKPPRTVLTKGLAGIGKSFAVQKFILDWAEEEANQDVDFVFFIAFRELNLSTGEKSFHELLTEFHPVLHDVEDAATYEQTKVTVILDGLDESRLQLDFDKVKVVTSIREVTSLDNLLVNLIQGDLLPKARLWITSRPAAANQIPAKYVDVVTEIRGFSEPQKEEYFRTRFTQDSSLADTIISHIRSSQSLDIMCHIPIFCWITAVLLEDVFGGDEEAETPQTLTEMMSHFLFAQTKRRSRKYEETTKRKKEELLKTHREFLLKLGKLAFVHLLNNKLIFYEEDLENCGINVKEASIYSGFCSSILREEKFVSQKKVFFFVHLTIQEFFAALYVYDCFINKNTEELRDFLKLKDKEPSLLDLLKKTVDKVLEKNNGHLYYFLRFLFGLMVETNRRVLQGLLTSPDPSQETDKKILTYLKSIRRKTVSPDNCINLFQTMVEMRDRKVKDEIQDYLKLRDRSKTDLTPLHCSALAYMLQVSNEDLDVLDLKSYNTTDEGRRRLIPAVRSSRKATLADCKVTAEWVEHLLMSLSLPISRLRDLDLSNNDLRDSGVKKLCEGLSSQSCKLKTLRLSGCLVTDTGCGFLASALQSNPSHLRELDLSYNNPGESGINRLTELKNDPQYKLNTLSFEYGGIHQMKPGFRKYACELTLDPNTVQGNLRLSADNRKVTWVEEQQSHHHPVTSDQHHQVLCAQALHGRCYFELEVEEPFNIGVTYRTTSSKEGEGDGKLGRNDKSWSLVCSDNGCYVLHGNTSVDVSSHCSRSSRVGVYLDKPAGSLSFYRVTAGIRTRLHTFQTTFTESLYAAAELHTCSSVSIHQLT